MGLSMEFYAGDADRIGRAFTDVELDGLRDGTLAHAHADLSLHLSPDHLDLLSEQIAKSVGRTPLLLLDSLDRTVGGTDEESEARIVLPSWVEIVARVSTDSIPSIAAAWMEAVGAQEGDESIESSPDVEVALRSLVDLCAQATARGSAVVFGWYL